MTIPVAVGTRLRFVCSIYYRAPLLRGPARRGGTSGTDVTVPRTTVRAVLAVGLGAPSNPNRTNRTSASSMLQPVTKRKNATKSQNNAQRMRSNALARRMRWRKYFGNRYKATALSQHMPHGCSWSRVIGIAHVDRLAPDAPLPLRTQSFHRQPFHRLRTRRFACWCSHAHTRPALSLL